MRWHTPFRFPWFLLMLTALGVAAPLPAATWKVETWRGPVDLRGATAAFDSLRHQVVVFGGHDGQDYLDTTWIWDVAGGTGWTLAAPATVPPPRDGAGMAFDPTRGVIVMFGGRNASGLLADTWEWDGSDWQQVVTNQVTGRRHFAMGYDPLAGVVVRYGGAAPTGTGSTTWHYDPATATWSAAVTNSPPGFRRYDAFAWSSAVGRLVLFGGYSSTGGYRGDTWTYDAATTTWTQVATTGPAPRGSYALAGDACGQLFLYGGYDGNQVFDDLWRFDGANWQPSAAVTPVMLGPRAAPVMFPGWARPGLLLVGGWDPLSGSFGNLTWSIDSCYGKQDTTLTMAVAGGQQIYPVAETLLIVDVPDGGGGGDGDGDGGGGDGPPPPRIDFQSLNGPNVGGVLYWIDDWRNPHALNKGWQVCFSPEFSLDVGQTFILASLLRTANGDRWLGLSGIRNNPFQPLQLSLDLSQLGCASATWDYNPGDGWQPQGTVADNTPFYPFGGSISQVMLVGDGSGALVLTLVYTDHSRDRFTIDCPELPDISSVEATVLETDTWSFSLDCNALAVSFDKTLQPVGAGRSRWGFWKLAIDIPETISSPTVPKGGGKIAVVPQNRLDDLPQRLEVTIEPPADADTLGQGQLLLLSATGDVDSAGTRLPDHGLGRVLLRRLDAAPPPAAPEFSLAPDFADLGATSHRLEVWDGGALVQTFPGLADSIRLVVDRLPDTYGHDAGMPGGLFLDWSAPRSFTFLAMPDTSVVVGDRLAVVPENPVLHSTGTAGLSLTASAGFPPLRFVLADPATAVPGGGRSGGTPAAVSVSPPAPNPFNPRVTVAFAQAQPGPVSVAVYDLRGRRVRTLLHERVEPAGRTTVTWDGVTDAGEPAPSGVYLFRVDTPAGRATVRATLVR